MIRQLLSPIIALTVFATSAIAQQPAPTVASPLSEKEAKFLATADEVLAEVSKLIGLPLKSPLKKSIRSRDDIREYLLKQLRESKEGDKRYADQRALERFGLLPRNFDLEGHLVDLLTEQIAGLYDPKAGEFYIADWMDPFMQRVVMAHELVHALHDQHFHVEKWTDAAKPNDDAQLARSAVLEGSATAAMLDYLLRDRPDLRVRDNPGFASLVRNVMGTNLTAASPELAKSPPFIRDLLVFPYLGGALFTQKVLQQHAGWPEFWQVFEKPPVSTQQILHPELYLKGVVPEPVELPDISRPLGKGWERLDENVMGEYGLQSILKQFLGEDRAAALAPSWAGDRYAIYENKAMKQTALAFRIRFSSEESALRFLGQYGEALEKKYEQRSQLFRRPGFFSFATPGGGVFLQCHATECVTLEGASRKSYDELVRAMKWPVPPRPPVARNAPKRANNLHHREHRDLNSAATAQRQASVTSAAC